MSDDAPVALVTGGGTGIGASCCRALAAEGFRVAVHYRSSEEVAKKLAAELEREGAREFMRAPEDAARIVEKMCAFDPADRYRDVRAVLDDLQMLKTGGST